MSDKIIATYARKKQLTKRVANLYRQLPSTKDFNYSRYADRIDACCWWLLFGFCHKDDFVRLLTASYCDVRHCVICMFRRALRQASLLCVAFHICREHHKTCRFLFLTLTFPNCTDEELSANVTRLSKSYRKLLNYRVLKPTLLGSFRSIECTYNEARDDYNLHMHAILCVKPSYFTKYYIKRSQWLEMWQRAFQDDSISQIDIQAVKDDGKGHSPSEKLMKVAFELGKYLIKSSDFKTADVLKAVHNAFHSRQLRSSTGLLRSALVEAKKRYDDFEKTEEGNPVNCPHCRGGLEKIWHEYSNGTYKAILRPYKQL